MAQDYNNLVWMDLEMTGLNPEHDRIIEMATIITDRELKTIAEGPVIVIHQSQELLDGMDEWNTRTHGKTGLTDGVKRSKITERQAEIETLDFIQRYTPKGRAPLCGNSICQDRRFLYRYMPELSDCYIIAILMSVLSKNYLNHGIRKFYKILVNAQHIKPLMTFVNLSKNYVFIDNSCLKMDFRVVM